jgi:secreted trypsin-like serine protease
MNKHRSIGALSLALGIMSCKPAQFFPKAPFASPGLAQIARVNAWVEEAQAAGALVPGAKGSDDHASAFGVLADESPTIGTNRVVGGTLFDKMPEIGALRYQRQPHCTGTVVGQRTVLTAGHCVQGFRSEEMEFGLGSSAWQPDRVLRVASMHAHPRYQPKPLGTNDVALVFLTEPAGVAPLALPNAGDVNAALGTRQALAFVGYGYATRPDGIKYRLGFKARTDMVPRSSDAFSFVYGDAEQGTCNGDSGGPALLFTSTGVTLVGITSWGDDACREKGVDMRIDPYLEFLSQYIDKPELLERSALGTQFELQPPPGTKGGNAPAAN